METTVQKTSLTPKFFFISLGVIVALITSVSSSLVLFFETLNKKFPDVLNSVNQYGYNSYTFDNIRSTLATLIIFFPLFLVLAYYWRKLSKSGLGIKDNVIFKWMIYLVLFLASLLIAIDLVTLVNYFVSGEITNRFIFKVLGTAVVAGLVWFNYFYELKNHDNLEFKNKFSIIYTSISIFLFLGLIILSFMIMGSPATQRALRLDERRINDLQNIQSQVISYYQQKEILPAVLSDLSNPLSGYSLPNDPEFEKGNIYEYIPKDNLSFDLCANFTADLPRGLQSNNNVNVTGPMVAGGEVKTTMALPAGAYPNGANDLWFHMAGHNCFTRTIDKDLYPIFKK